VTGRVTRLRNRLRRAERRLAAYRRCDTDLASVLTEICADEDLKSRDTSTVSELIEAVEDYLDRLIEPRSPLLEWVTDVGIDIAAAVAVDIYLGRGHRLEARVDNLRRRLVAAQARVV